MMHYFLCVNIDPIKNKVLEITYMFSVEDTLLDEYDQTMFLTSLETINQDKSIIVDYPSEIKDIFVKLYNIIYRSKKFNEWFCVFHSEKTESEIRQILFNKNNFELVLKGRIEI